MEETFIKYRWLLSNIGIYIYVTCCYIWAYYTDGKCRLNQCLHIEVYPIFPHIICWLLIRSVVNPLMFILVEKVTNIQMLFLFINKKLLNGTINLIFKLCLLVPLEIITCSFFWVYFIYILYYLGIRWMTLNISWVLIS